MIRNKVVVIEGVCLTEVEGTTPKLGVESGDTAQIKFLRGEL